MTFNKKIALQLVLLATVSSHSFAQRGLDRSGNQSEASYSSSPYATEANVTGVMSSIMSNEVSGTDPFSGKIYENVMLGKVYKTASFFNNTYTHYRYVTLFEVEKQTERIAYLNSYDEACHDDSFFMAEWSSSKTLTVSLETKAGFEQLGLSASVGLSVSEGVTFSNARKVKAVKGVEAIHHPYSYKEVHTGITYIMTYNMKTDEHFVRRYSDFNFAQKRKFRKYPFKYKLDNQNIGFRVQREVISHCGNTGDEEVESANDGRDVFFPQ